MSLPAAADRNLLFGILALQMDFISRDALIAGMHAWVLDKGKPLGQILLAQQHLAADVLPLLDALVQKHLAQHGNDAQQSLAALGALGAAREDLLQLGDGDVQASLAALPSAERKQGAAEDDALATRSYSVGQSSSAGSRFLVLRPWAEGGLGKVSVARDVELRREVALKEIKEKHADDPSSRGRFLMEAEITGGLEHPGIVPVYGLGMFADGRPYYAMRFIRGDSLKDAIACFHKKSTAENAEERGENSLRSSASSAVSFSSLDFRQLLRRFVDVCNAIAYAHSRGVLHRDLKPGNIMLGKYGETFVVDWGLAKAAGRSQGAGGSWQEAGDSGVETGEPGSQAINSDADSPLEVEPPLTPSGSEHFETMAGTAVGTPAFMSPEQAAGRLDLLSPASDVYSLGATLFSILTGQPPLKNMPSPDILRHVQRGEIPAPRQLQQHVPAPLDAVCRKAMALDAADRYATPRALADEIEHWLADQPVSAWPEPWTTKARRTIGRHRVLTASIAAVIVVSAGLLLIGNMLLSKANTDLEKANVAVRAVNEHLEKANSELEISKKDALAAAANEKAAHDATAQVLAVSHMMLARSRFEENQAGLADAWLQKVPQPLRGSAWGLLKNYVAGSLFTLAEHTAPVAGVAVSLDGRWLASASWDQSVIVWDARTGQKLRTLRGHSGLVTAVAISPDGLWLATASADKTVKLWDMRTGQDRLTLDKHTMAVNGVAFSPDGAWLASAGADKTVKLWDARTGKELRNLTGHIKSVSSVAFSSDGTKLASASIDMTVKLWSPHADGEPRTFSGHKLGVKSVAISPDGQWLASASLDKTVKLWDTRTQLAAATFDSHADAVNAVAFSPDGQRLASASADRTVKLWDVRAALELRTFKGHADAVAGVTFSPDGQQLISSGHDLTVKLWTARPGEELRTLRGPPHLKVAVAVSSSRRWLAVANFDQTVTLWDAWTGLEKQALRGHNGNVTSLAAYSDGDSLASGSADHTVKLWDARTGLEKHTLRGHAGIVTSVAVSGDGSWLASGSVDGTVKTWDAKTGNERRTLSGHRKPVHGVAISNDGQWLASASFDKTVKLWHTRFDQEPRTLDGHTSPVLAVAFSPDGRWLASAGEDKTVIVWDTRSGAKRHTLAGHLGKVTSLAFHPDSQWLVSASYDGTLILWDAQTGQELRTLRGHTAPVAGVAVSADGLWLVSASHDRTLKIWDARSDAELAKEMRFRHWATASDLSGRRELVNEAKKVGTPAALGFHLAWFLAGEAEQRATSRPAAAHAGWLGVAHQRWPALAAVPSLAPPHFDRGAVLAGILTQATGPTIERLRIAAAQGVALEPANWHNHALYGAVLYRAGDYARALEVLQRAAELRGAAGTNVWLASFLAMTHAKLGQAEQARKMQSQAAPPADAPWQEAVLYELLRPEVEQAIPN